MRPNFVTNDNMMPAGKYYVGDLCYVMNNQWDEICGTIIQEKSCVDGVFTLRDGTRFAIVSTHFGDGSYNDRNGNTYSVDSGSIGCVLLSVAELDENYTNALKHGLIREFDEPFEVSGDQRGHIYFGDVVIDTGDHDICDTDDQYDEYDEYDDDEE